MSEMEADPFEVARRHALECVTVSRNLYDGVRYLDDKSRSAAATEEYEEALRYLVDDFLDFRAVFHGLDDPFDPIQPVDRALTRVRESGLFCCDWDEGRFLNAHRAAVDIVTTLRISLDVSMMGLGARAHSLWQATSEDGNLTTLLQTFGLIHKKICELVLDDSRPPDISLDIEWESLQARERFPHLVEGFRNPPAPAAVPPTQEPPQANRGGELEQDPGVKAKADTPLIVEVPATAGQPAPLTNGPVEAGVFRWDGAEVRSLTLHQWRLLASLCKGERLRDSVPVAEVIRAVYGPQARATRDRRRALASMFSRVEEKLHRGGLRLLIDRDSSTVSLSLTPTGTARTQS
jgi:hypothetical protein